MIDIRRGADRRTTRTPWLLSRHSFAFGRHYDPTNTGFGSLVSANDDVVAPGGGFTAHAHRDLEIVSWVVEGSLRHEDDAGNQAVVAPGQVQWLTAGTGVEHAETNASSDHPVRYVQMWLQPQVAGTAPRYEVVDVSEVLGLGGLAAVIRLPGATLWVARLDGGDQVDLPDAPWVHVYLTGGAGALTPGGPLEEGDAARLQAAGPVGFRASSTTELLVWEMGDG